jgi:MFS family permease
MAIVRYRPSWLLAGFMALWAIVSTMTGIAHNFTGLLLTRFFLGILEAPFWPGCLYLLSMFYTKKEIATRISILFSANIAGTAFAGLIAIGVFHMEGVAGLAGWRWLFIIQGIITFVIAVASGFILPNEPLQTKWLSPEERELAHSRISLETVELQADTTTWKGLKDACSDYKLWLMILMNHLHMGATNYKNFFPTIVGSLGFSRTATLALTAPPYIIAGIVAVAYSWNSGRVNERTWHITVANAIAVLGFVLAAATLNVGARYFAMVLFASGVYATAGIAPGWVAVTCGQTKEKKAIALALNNAISTIAPIYTSVRNSHNCARISTDIFSICGQLRMRLAMTLRWVLAQGSL